MALDAGEEIRRIDQSGMLPLMEQAANRLTPPSDANSTCRIAHLNPTNVVLAGVGGSGIVGDILADACRATLRLPITVCRSVKIPTFVDKGTLFVAISYSGQTLETIDLFEQAKRVGAKLIVISSGGKLVEIARSSQIPYVHVRSNLLPRVALPELVAAVTFALGEAGVLADAKGLLASATTALQETVGEVNSSVPLNRNPAKQMAQALTGRLPLLIGSEECVSVLRRFKNELNENSKVPAFFYTVPEAYHDDIEGLKSLAQLSRPQALMLRNLNETKEEARLRESLAGLLTTSGFPPSLYFGGHGEGRFAWLLSAITLGDFVSFYLAMLNGVDPSKMDLIRQFREIRGQV